MIEAQERHEKSPKKGQVVKPDAAPQGGDFSYPFFLILHNKFAQKIVQEEICLKQINFGILCFSPKIQPSDDLL